MKNKMRLAMLGMMLLVGASIGGFFACGGGGGTKGLTSEKLQEEINANKTPKQILQEYKIDEMEDPVKIELGQYSLQSNDPESAKTCYSAVAPGSTEYGTAQYGILMATFQELAAQIAVAMGAIDMISGMMAPVEPQQASDMYTMIESTAGLNKMFTILKSLKEQAKKVVDGGYTIKLVDFPFKIGKDQTEPIYVNMTINGENGEFAARLMWAICDLGMAIIDYLGAHAWNMDLGKMMSRLGDLTSLTGGVEGMDVIGLLRSFAWLVSDSPTFFDKSPVRWNTNMSDLKNLVDTGADNIKQIDTALLGTKVSKASDCQKSLCLIDKDGDGKISGGDQIYVNATVKVVIGTALLDLAGGLTDETVSQIDEVAQELKKYGIDISASKTSGITVDVDLKSNEIVDVTGDLSQLLAGALPALETLLDKVVASIKSSTTDITVADINPVLEALGLPPLANALSINLNKFLDMPLNDLMAWYCVDANGEPVGDPLTACPQNTTPQFMIELEMSDREAICQETGICGTGDPKWYYLEGDSAHFVGVTGYQYEADGLVPPGADAPIPYLFYTAIPVIDGKIANDSLKVDLQALPATCGGTGQAGNWEPATNKTGNILLNCIIIDYVPQLLESDLVKKLEQALSPFLEALGLPAL